MGALIILTEVFWRPRRQRFQFSGACRQGSRRSDNGKLGCWEMSSCMEKNELVIVTACPSPSQQASCVHLVGVQGKCYFFQLCCFKFASFLWVLLTDGLHECHSTELLPPTHPPPHLQRVSPANLNWTRLKSKQQITVAELFKRRCCCPKLATVLRFDLEKTNQQANKLAFHSRHTDFFFSHCSFSSDNLLVFPSLQILTSRCAGRGRT